MAPQFRTVKLDPTKISRDQAQVELYKTDELISLDGAKAGLALALLNGINKLKLQFKHFNYPVLIMHGGDDKITNPAGSKAIYKQCSSKDKTLHIWDGAYHEIFNEINKDEVIKMMTSWIDERI
ncbi:MAG: alpha/beta hydrolase [Saprospiraceae bacterium]|nr:alpha/beta hydrolase [Saprospiraceae bacterium]